jgi:hypothetical protein
MAKRRAIPLGSRIERLEHVGDRYELCSRVDAWPIEPVDASTVYSRELEGYVHTRVELDDGGWSALALSPDAAAEQATYLELDNYDRPFPVTERGLEAVRAADELQALPATDSKLADLASTIADAAGAEARSLRFALFRRLYTVFDRTPAELSPAVFHLAPWELVDEAAEAVVSAIAEGHAAPQPNLAHYFRDAAPGLTSALAALAASAPETNVEEISALAAALLRLSPERIPVGTRSRLSDLVETLERLPAAEPRRHQLHELRRHLEGEGEAEEHEAVPAWVYERVARALGIGRPRVVAVLAPAPTRGSWGRAVVLGGDSPVSARATPVADGVQVAVIGLPEDLEGGRVAVVAPEAGSELAWATVSDGRATAFLHGAGSEAGELRELVSPIAIVADASTEPRW